MLYSVYVHPGDAQHAHGLTIPDFPGCFSAADDWATLPTQIQEAVEVYCDGEDLVIPPPTPLDELVTQPDYQGGVWVLVDIDLRGVNSAAIRLD